MRLAVIADVHANTRALRSVLDDIGAKGITQVLNLGDSVYGPFDPAGTAVLLMQPHIQSISGNQDRILVHPTDDSRKSSTWRFVMEKLLHEQLQWLASLPATRKCGNVFAFHGTPSSDEEYLMEHVTKEGVFLFDSSSIQKQIDGVSAEVMVCGHTHVARSVQLDDGRLVVNPGSVGLPAYSDDLPFPHVMESGSPHARYAILTHDASNWSVENVALAYDWESAAKDAEANGRSDWAEWIRTGRSTLRR
ncbi:MAG: metallophosphoesterase family protein [Ignavibacteriae bacterium]|nr:metallophosphoesterase family protein [Ignavibacteriota bacterium]